MACNQLKNPTGNRGNSARIQLGHRNDLRMLNTMDPKVNNPYNRVQRCTQAGEKAVVAKGPLGATTTVLITMSRIFLAGETAHPGDARKLLNTLQERKTRWVTMAVSLIPFFLYVHNKQIKWISFFRCEGHHATWVQIVVRASSARMFMRNRMFVALVRWASAVTVCNHSGLPLFNCRKTINRTLTDLSIASCY